MPASGSLGPASDFAAEKHPIEARLPDVRALCRAVAALGCQPPVSSPSIARFRRGVVLREDPLRLDEVIIDEAHQAEQERETDRAGGKVRIEPLQLPDEEDLDGERGQRNQDRGHVQTNLPLHVVTSLGRFGT